MRLFYSKHQCYVVGEGSFAGRYGHLPDTQEEDESSEPEVSIGQHITLSSRKRVTSNLRLLSQQSSKKIIVKADVEPTSSTDLEERVVMNVCSSESQLGSPEAASLSASLPPSSPSRLTRQPELSGSGINQKLQEDLTQATDHVVSEDGKLETSSCFPPLPSCSLPLLGLLLPPSFSSLLLLPPHSFSSLHPTYSPL